MLETRIAATGGTVPSDPSAVDFDARLVSQESAAKIQILEEEIRKQQQYAQSEMKDLAETCERQRQELELLREVTAERDSLAAEVDRLHSYAVQDGGHHDRQTEEIERVYLEKIAILNAELVSQQRFAAEENEQLRRQVGTLQTQIATLSATDADRAALQQRMNEFRPDATELVQLKEENYQLHASLEAAAEKIRQLTDELRRQVTYSEAEIARLTAQVLESQNQVS